MRPGVIFSSGPVGISVGIVRFMATSLVKTGSASKFVFEAVLLDCVAHPVKLASTSASKGSSKLSNAFCGFFGVIADQLLAVDFVVI
jgi:hypothetical protein